MLPARLLGRHRDHHPPAGAGALPHGAEEGRGEDGGDHVPRGLEDREHEEPSGEVHGVLRRFLPPFWPSPAVLFATLSTCAKFAMFVFAAFLPHIAAFCRFSGQGGNNPFLPNLQVECKEIFYRTLPELNDELAPVLSPGATNLEEVGDFCHISAERFCHSGANASFLGQSRTSK